MSETAAIRTRASALGGPQVGADPVSRVHGLQNRFNIDLFRLGRMAGAAVARMARTISAIDLPFEEAISFLRSKAKTPTKSWRDVWDAAHSKMFMVAGANTEAIVTDFQDAIGKALEQGTTLDAFRKDFDRIVKTHGWSYKGERGWRTRTIFETNLRTAYAAGRYAQMTRPETLAAFPYWRYNHSGALHPRLQHKNWDQKVYAADDPFWTVAYPPNGFGCGCFVTPVSMRGLKAMGKDAPDRSPDLDQLGTDQPLGVDPSFAYNPGLAWLRQTWPGPMPVTAKEAGIAAFARSAARGKWPDGSWTPVGKVDGAKAGALDVAVETEIRLTAEAIRAANDTISAEDLAAISRWIKSARLAKDGRGRLAMIGGTDEQAYRLLLDVDRAPASRAVRVTKVEKISKAAVRRIREPS